ncbi:hypothetical protein QAD02_020095 [Eretmocerus hayati]|uniref:Uncharacterized protein n=1 Tax=Eretmocerus hayati TaxID=131215 RepID=A0ACC2PMI2_9HYME|nr:hypothetical protein QAD02_020095 [Eretmocerus hayati]
MAEDVLITFLPDEVTELILENKQLEIRDVLNFALTCKHLHKTVLSSNKLWRKKLYQRWPLLKEVYWNHENQQKVRVWWQEVQANFIVRKTMLDQLSLMSSKFHHKIDLAHSEFEGFDPLFKPERGAHPLAYHFLTDELMRLISIPIMDGNLTHKYYAQKLMRYIKQSQLSNEWQKFIELPPHKQLLESGAVFVAQWSQPDRHITHEGVGSMLDDIVEQAKDVLKEKHPSHPIFNTPCEQFEYWKKNNIDDNQWSIVETRQVISALTEVIFNRLGFYSNSEMYYSSENSFIDRVLEHKRGIPIILAIIFESVCRRVGVKCEPIIFPSHFLLRWKEKYTGYPFHGEGENYYIDVFNNGRFITRQNCPRISNVSRCPIERYNTLSASSVVEVVERLANNLEVASRQRTVLNGRATRLRSALELIHLVRPHDTGAILHLARFYMLHQMNLAKLVDILTQIKKDPEFTCRGPANHILQMLQDYEKRNNVMTEVMYEENPEWSLDMSLEDLSKGANQPFYKVFVDDGSRRHVAQENLTMPTDPGWVDHHEIGKYFNQFKKSHYVPNREKADQYPEDSKIREELVSRYS